MKGDRVLVRADRQRPLERIIVAEGKRVFYRSRPDLFAQVAKAGGGVGFPKDDVFQYDPDLFAKLSEQWDASGQVDLETWHCATS